MSVKQFSGAALYAAIAGIYNADVSMRNPHIGTTEYRHHASALRRSLDLFREHCEALDRELAELRADPRQVEPSRRRAEATEVW